MFYTDVIVYLIESCILNTHLSKGGQSFKGIPILFLTYLFNWNTDNRP